MFWALAVILLAFAGFTVFVVRLRRPTRAADETGPTDRPSPGRIDLEQLKGFVYVGAAALTLLALAVILLAFASFTVIVVRLRHPASAADDSSEASPDTGRRIDHEQLRGFVYVGAGALALLAVAVILMGLFGNRTGRAEGLAVLGFFGYLAYLVAATLVLYVMGRKS